MRPALHVHQNSPTEPADEPVESENQLDYLEEEQAKMTDEQLMRSGVELRVCRKIDPNDSMHHGSDSQYFDVGLSALSAVMDALIVANRAEAPMRRVLDYACGYGRVARWLAAAFPDADMLCVDADPQAIASVSANLGATSRLADLSLKTDLGCRFDLIWMGSLITHLSAGDTADVLSYVQRHLAPQGLIVATMHGTYVAERIRRKEKLYGLQDEQVRRLLGDYDILGYGFGVYPNQKDYGISVSSPAVMQRICNSQRLRVIADWEKRWANHQDVYVLEAAG